MKIDIETEEIVIEETETVTVIVEGIVIEREMTEAGTAEEVEVGKDVGVGKEEVAGEVEVLTDSRRGHHHEGKVAAGLVKEEETVALVQVPSNSQD